MRNLLGRYVNRYEKKHRDFRHYAMIVAVLALVVFVGVNWRSAVRKRQTEVRGIRTRMPATKKRRS